MAILVRATDGALRDAQADLLKLVIPIINVMEIINNSGNLTSDSLCARTILHKLGDAITFAGNVNLALIKRRKEVEAMPASGGTETMPKT